MIIGFFKRMNWFATLWYRATVTPQCHSAILFSQAVSTRTFSASLVASTSTLQWF